MTLEELQKALREGKAVTSTNGYCYYRIEGGMFTIRDGYTDTLVTRTTYFPLSADDFLKDDTGYKLFSKEPIITESEKKYLADVIRPFRDKLKVTIEKFNKGDCDYFITIHIRENDGSYFHDIDLAPFSPDEMYTGMELGKEYSLEELGL